MGERDCEAAAGDLTQPKGTLPDRETILGVWMKGAARAFPLSKLTIANSSADR